MLWCLPDNFKVRQGKTKLFCKRTPLYLEENPNLVIVSFYLLTLLLVVTDRCSQICHLHLKVSLCSVTPLIHYHQMFAQVAYLYMGFDMEQTLHWLAGMVKSVQCLVPLICTFVLSCTAHTNFMALC